jgi:hypothetical protein
MTDSGTRWSTHEERLILDAFAADRQVQHPESSRRFDAVELRDRGVSDKLTQNATMSDRIRRIAR